MTVGFGRVVPMFWLIFFFYGFSCTVMHRSRVLIVLLYVFLGCVGRIVLSGFVVYMLFFSGQPCFVDVLLAYQQ